MSDIATLPPWFKQKFPDMQTVKKLKESFRRGRLSTVCEGARCPNLGECWGKGVATFMIMGDTCTRACRFCAVRSGRPFEIDPDEPASVASTVRQMNLKYAVITSVTRDDLPDGGAGHFAKTVKEIKASLPQVKIEVLIPDFCGRDEALAKVIQSGADVIGHNMETVERLSPLVRPQADYQRSLTLIKDLKRSAGRFFVKSGFMVGLGETAGEIKELMKDLLLAGCEILTIGQYLRPARTPRHVAVERFVAPEEFEEYRILGLEMGFNHVTSGPLVRSSYMAEQGYRDGMRIREQKARLLNPYQKDEQCQ